MNRREILTVAASLILVTAGASTMAAAQQGKEPIRIPYAHVFSGPAADFGERIWREGGAAAMEQINKKGGIKGRPLEFYKIDVRFPETTPWVTDFRRLAADQTIPIIFGVGATKSHLAIFDLVEEAKIPILNPSSAGVWPLPGFGQWNFRYQPQADTVMPVLVAKIKARFNPKTAALVFGNDDEALVNNAKTHKQVLEKNGIQVIIEQTYRAKETNFAPQVSAIRSAKPDIVVLAMQPYDGGTFSLQMRERGLTQQILGDSTFAAEDFWRQSKGKAEGAIGYSLYTPYDERPIVKEWIKLWRERTGKADAFPDSFVTAYYDAAHILAHVLGTAKDMSRQSIRDALATLKEFETVSGRVSYNGAGDAIRQEPVLVQWMDGKLVPWK